MTMNNYGDLNILGVGSLSERVVSERDPHFVFAVGLLHRDHSGLLLDHVAHQDDTLGAGAAVIDITVSTARIAFDYAFADQLQHDFMDVIALDAELLGDLTFAEYLLTACALTINIFTHCFLLRFHRTPSRG